MSPAPRRSERRRSQLEPRGPLGSPWDTSGDPAACIEVRPYSLEGRAVADYCVRAMPEDVEIVAIERVESLKPWQLYEKTRQELLQTLHQEDPSCVIGMEAWLWHGTAESKIKDLVASGFPDPPGLGKPGAKFSVDPRLAFIQARDEGPSSDGYVRLLLVRVAVGRAGESESLESPEGDPQQEKENLESIVSANGCEVSVLGKQRACLAYTVKCRCPSLAPGLDSDPLWRLDEGRDMLAVDFKAFGRGRRGGLQLELVKRNEELAAQIDALEAGMEHAKAAGHHHSHRGTTILPGGLPAFVRRTSTTAGQEDDDSDSDSNEKANSAAQAALNAQWHTSTHRNVKGGARGSLLKADAPHELSNGQRMVLVTALNNNQIAEAKEALTLPPGQTGLSLELRLDDLGPTAVVRLAEALPGNLQHLELGLTGCAIGSHGARALAKHLPARLIRLDLGLEFGGVGDEGMLALARRLPRTLVHLELGLVGCRIGSKGAKSLADNLPREMVHLRLGLTGCCIGPEGANFISSKIPASLIHLDIDFSNCRIGAKGAAILADHLPSGVVHLHLDLFNCRIGDEGAIALGAKLPEGLVYMHMSFIGNGITGKGMKSLCDKLPDSLVYLHLCFTGNKIKDDGAMALANALPEEELVHLRLNLTGCGILEEGKEALRYAVEAREGLATKEIMID